MSTLKTKLEILVGAGQPYILVRSDEPNEVDITLDSIELVQDTFRWDMVDGLVRHQTENGVTRYTSVEKTAGDTGGGFNHGLREVLHTARLERNRDQTRNVIGQDYPVNTPTLLIVSNIDIILRVPVARQMLMNMYRTFELESIHIVAVCGTSTVLPAELHPLFETIDHELPDSADLARVLVSLGEIRDRLERKEITPAYVAKVAESGLGLTRNQMRNAVASYLFASDLAAESFGKETMKLADYVFRTKCDRLNQEGLVKILLPEAGFESLGGMEAMKAFHLAILKTTNGSHIPECRVNGTLLVSFPGAGKTAFATALAKEIDSGAVLMDFGQMLGGIVGESEAKTRRAFSLVETIAPPQKRKPFVYTDKDREKYGDEGRAVFEALNKLTDNHLIVVWDEIEKGLQGADSGVRDGGVGQKQLGYVLTWLSTRKSKTFVIATANHGDKLHEALTRAERFDKIFFVDKPSNEQKKIIWDLYIKKFELPEQELPRDDNWTGAEIKSCCRLAKMQNQLLVDIGDTIVPIFVQHADKLEALEKWARTRCISSETGKLYGKEDSSNKLAVVNQARPNVSRVIKPRNPRDN